MAWTYFPITAGTMVSLNQLNELHTKLLEFEKAFYRDFSGHPTTVHSLDPATHSHYSRRPILQRTFRMRCRSVISNILDYPAKSTDHPMDGDYYGDGQCWFVDGSSWKRMTTAEVLTAALGYSSWTDGRLIQPVHLNEIYTVIEWLKSRVWCCRIPVFAGGSGTGKNMSYGSTSPNHSGDPNWDLARKNIHDDFITNEAEYWSIWREGLVVNNQITLHPTGRYDPKIPHTASTANEPPNTTYWTYLGIASTPFPPFYNASIWSGTSQPPCAFTEAIYGDPYGPDPTGYWSTPGEHPLGNGDNISERGLFYDIIGDFLTSVGARWPSVIKNSGCTYKLWWNGGLTPDQSAYHYYGELGIDLPVELNGVSAGTLTAGPFSGEEQTMSLSYSDFDFATHDNTLVYPTYREDLIDGIWVPPDLIDDVAAWADDTDYVAHQEVKKSSVHYRCKLDHHSELGVNDPPNVTYWEVISVPGWERPTGTLHPHVFYWAKAKFKGLMIKPVFNI